MIVIRMMAHIMLLETITKRQYTFGDGDGNRAGA